MSVDTIWVLTSVENLYDQPPNNLVAWWAKKPDLKALKKAAGGYTAPISDVELNELTGSGKTQARSDPTCYSLREIEEGLLT